MQATPDGWDGYDTVLVGYPIWWGVAAWPVNHFVSDNDFSGKTVASLQLDDWGERSAANVIELTEWLIDAYNVYPARVYLPGCSGGGETISVVLGERPELYRRRKSAQRRWVPLCPRRANNGMALLVTRATSTATKSGGPANQRTHRFLNAICH